MNTSLDNFTNQNESLEQILRNDIRYHDGCVLQTSKMESFATIVKAFTLLTIGAKLSILDVCGVSLPSPTVYS